MFKKILIPSFAFFGMSLLALITARVEDRAMEVNKIEKSAYNPVVVLELFTSQGCSSCPPADMLLERAKKQYPEEVFALSYHVDYWNYIGWEDPFSKSIFTRKQRDYNRKFKYRSNYTPQLVVNGKEHFVGSNSSKLTSNIATYRTEKTANKVVLKNVVTSDFGISFDFGVNGNLERKQLRAVLVLDERTTSVKRGENRNRTLKNSNIVVAEKYIALQSSGGKSSISIPNIVSKGEDLTLMLLVEADNLDVTAAAKASVKL
ncbi:thioredoxin family protein [Flagellimonas sp. S3867]|uniref:DUF1223 domain-containing protein n=1 Tax=Flagellimonas sp. S3867 TaxID=2768063 RepID=UPI00168780EF|nr:DUF1223 domain-containing protein [Flagellimonas sp. S3867]